ncbi:MAG: glycerol-3-phosphate 1-O-acyltransferase PlsY [Candidatus Ornithomonoglobus sp.]
MLAIEYVIIAVLVVIAYLIGSVNSSILISRIVAGKDIRESGSGNAGATNMLRTMGKKYAVITLIIDILKGVIAVLIVKLWLYQFFTEEAAAADSDFQHFRYILTLIQPQYIAGVCVVLGHNFPVFFGFKGGKGVATSLGVVLMLDWKIGLVALAAALAIMALTRYVSLGSIMAAVIFAVLETVMMAVHNEFNAVRFICVIILAGLLIVRHHANIGRLIHGPENRLGSKKKED